MGLTLDPAKLVTRSGGDNAPWVVLEYWPNGVDKAERPITAYCDDYKSPVRNKEWALEILEERMLATYTSAASILRAIRCELDAALLDGSPIPDNGKLQLTSRQLTALTRYSGVSGEPDGAKIFNVPVEVVAEFPPHYLVFG